MEKQIKTNVMRILDQHKISYQVYYYENDGQAVDGVSVAHKIGQPVEMVFKTLVTRGASGQHYVMVIPVAQELDLKKAARCVKEKSVEMIPVSSIQSVTGYIRGGCSPVGMKKLFPTLFDESATQLSKMIVSAGKIGIQIEVDVQDLATLVKADFQPMVFET